MRHPVCYTDARMKENNSNQALIEKMYEIGAHYGYSRKRRHPSVVPFLFGTRNRIDLIDLAKTEELLASAKEFMATAGRLGQTVLLVGTKAEAKAAIQSAADKLDMPFANTRWVGGSLTNFDQIRGRVKRLVDLKEKKEKGELVYQTKKELLLLEREMDKLDRNFGGLVSLDKMPDIMLIVDPLHEESATNEANQLGIPVVALANSDCDISNVSYPIVANDASVSSISFFIGQLAESYTSAKSGK